MNNEYEKNIKVSYTNVDQNIELGLLNLVSEVQDTSTEYFEGIGSDNVVIKEECNAAWVITKMKFHINKYPKWQDNVKLTSYTSDKTKIRIEVEAKGEDQNHNLLFVGKQEVCPIDLTSRKIRKIETIKYPQDVEVRPTLMENAFEKLDYNFIETDKVCDTTVHSIDIDFTKHVNNVNYVRYLMNTFDSDFLNNNKITDLEIHYLHESTEKDILQIYRKVNNNNIDFLIKNGEHEVVRARFMISQK